MTPLERAARYDIVAVHPSGAKYRMEVATGLVSAAERAAELMRAPSRPPGVAVVMIDAALEEG